MQEMVYLKTIIKSAPMGVSASGTTGQKTYLKKFRGGFSPLSLPTGSAYISGTWKAAMCSGFWSTAELL